MANREENIKKINDELEKLDDEQLEQVAGGMNWLFSDVTDGNQNTDPAANLFTAGYRPKCMLKDSPI